MRVIEKCERDRASVFVRVRVCVCVRLYSTPTTISRLPQKHSISNANRRGSKMGVEGVWGPDPRAIICRKTPVLHNRHNINISSWHEDLFHSIFGRSEAASAFDGKPEKGCCDPKQIIDTDAGCSDVDSSTF